MKKLPFDITVEKLTKNSTGNYELDAQENDTSNELSFVIHPKRLDNLSADKQIHLSLYLTLPITNTKQLRFLYNSNGIQHIKQCDEKAYNNKYTVYSITIDTNQWKTDLRKLTIQLSDFSLTEPADATSMPIQQFDAFFEYQDAVFQHRFDVLHTGEGKYHDLYKAITIYWQQPTYETGKGTSPYKQFALQDVMPLYKSNADFKNEFKLLLKNKSGDDLKLSEANTRFIFSMMNTNGEKIELSNHIGSVDTWNSSGQDGVFIFSPKANGILPKDAVLEISFSNLPIENTTAGKLKLEIRGVGGYYDKIDELNFEVKNLPEPEVFFNVKSYLNKDKIYIENHNKGGKEIIEFDYKTKFLQKNNSKPVFTLFLKNVGPDSKRIELSKIKNSNDKYFISDGCLQFLDGTSKQIIVLMEGKGVNGKTTTSELVLTLADAPPLISLDYIDKSITTFPYLEKLKLKCNYKWIDEKNLRLYYYENGKKSEKKMVDFIYKDNYIEIQPRHALNNITCKTIELFLEVKSEWETDYVFTSNSISVSFNFPKEPLLSVSKKAKTRTGDMIKYVVIDVSWQAENAKSIELIEYNNDVPNSTVLQNNGHKEFMENTAQMTFVVTPLNPLADKIERNVFNELHKGQVLKRDQYIDSDNNQYRLKLQQDGNLVLWKKNDYSLVWQTNTGGKGVEFAEFQAHDGNFVLYNHGRENAKWAFNMENNGGSKNLNNKEYNNITQIMLSDAGVLEAKDANGNIIWYSKK